MLKSTKAIYFMGTFIGFFYALSGECVDWQKYVPDMAKKYLPSNESDGSNESTFYGPVSMQNKTLKQSLKVMGPLVLSDSEVQGEVKVYGPLSGKSITMDSLTVQGPADIQSLKVGDMTISGPLNINNSLISGSVIVNGPINSSNTVFQKEISVASKSLTFSNSEIQNLTIKPSTDIMNKPQIVYLKGTTVVSGNITFEEGNGIIKADKSVVIKGVIKGGTRK